MNTLFDKEFYTDEYDQEILDFINENFGEVRLESKNCKGCLMYDIVIDTFYTSESAIHCNKKVLTKKQFKEKIGMIDKLKNQDNMVSYKLIDKEGYLSHHSANKRILFAVGGNIFKGHIDEVGHLFNETIDTTSLIDTSEFKFFKKVEEEGQLDSAVTGNDDTPYQDLVDDCKELNINLIVTENGLHILDCINCIEYEIEDPDDYQKIVDAIHLLQNKEMN